MEKRPSPATPEGRVKGGKNSTKYRVQYAQDLRDYVDSCLANDTKPTLFAFMRIAHVYNRNTFTKWAEAHPEFAEAYEYYKEASRDFIVGKALTGAYDSSFSKFILSCDYGMKEKSEVDSSVKITVELPAEADEEAY